MDEEKLAKALSDIVSAVDAGQSAEKLLSESGQALWFAKQSLVEFKAKRPGQENKLAQVLDTIISAVETGQPAKEILCESGAVLVAARQILAEYSKALRLRRRQFAELIARAIMDLGVTEAAGCMARSLISIAHMHEQDYDFRSELGTIRVERRSIPESTKH